MRTTVSTLILLTIASMCVTADCSAAEVVLIDAEGRVYVQDADGKTKAKAGAKLAVGERLLIAEDSTATLLYRDGRFSRVEGPAKVQITAGRSNHHSQQLSGQMRERLAAAFRTAGGNRVTSTVGGVRGAKLVVLSPCRYGLTPNRFRMVVLPPARNSRQLNSLALADEIRISGRASRKHLFELPVDTHQLANLSRTVDLGDAAEGLECDLEIQFVEVDEDGELLNVIDRSGFPFRIASESAQQQLLDDLQRVEIEVADELDDSSLRSLRRIGVFLKHEFRGEALAELFEMQRRQPTNPIWTALRNDLLTEPTTAP